MTHELPRRKELVRAFLRRDSKYEGVFVVAVRTTGIFCRPGCPARTPKLDNVGFFGSCRDALLAGYRPCKRCDPLAPKGKAPSWLEPVLAAVEQEPTRRWRDADLRGLGVEPSRVSRWFKTYHGLTFHAYSRARRLSAALGWLQEGERVTEVAYQVGYDSLSGFNEAFQKFASRSPTQTRGATIVHVARLETPLGPVVGAATKDHLLLLEFADRRALSRQIGRVSKALRCVFSQGETRVLTKLRVQLDEFFRGERTTFDVPLHTRGTPFQSKVWSALREIPVGSTRSYTELAKGIGRPTAVRAVARANGDNPIAILIPCHRVIGSHGDLVGYGGGVWRKQRLLELEAAGNGVGRSNSHR